MSARKTAFILNPAARRDLQSIALFSEDQWGRPQSDDYLDAIDRAFATLIANPRIGRVHINLGPNIRAFRMQMHIIYYRLDADTVTVLRVLHAKMNAGQRVE